MRLSVSRGASRIGGQWMNRWRTVTEIGGGSLGSGKTYMNESHEEGKGRERNHTPSGVDDIEDHSGSNQDKPTTKTPIRSHMYGCALLSASAPVAPVAVRSWPWPRLAPVCRGRFILLISIIASGFPGRCVVIADAINRVPTAILHPDALFTIIVILLASAGSVLLLPPDTVISTCPIPVCDASNVCAGFSSYQLLTAPAPVSAHP